MVTNTNISVQEVKEKWLALAVLAFSMRSINYTSNIAQVRRIFAEHEDLVAPLVALCPQFVVILCYILEDQFGFRVRKVDRKSLMGDWGEEECQRVGCSMACFLRNRKTGEAAVAAWRLHYAQLNELFVNVVGFEEFIVDIASKTLKEAVYGTVYRVSTGAFFSTLDAATDIYTIVTYYKNGLRGLAVALLAMISINMMMQLFMVSLQVKKKSWNEKLKEVMITLFFLRPAVDAYRVSTNYQNDDGVFDPFVEVRSAAVRHSNYETATNHSPLQFTDDV